MKKELYDRDIGIYKERFPDDFYGLSCLKSAKKVVEAYNKEMETGGHSGMSAGITKNIVINYLNDVSYFPIEDNDFKWVEGMPPSYSEEALKSRGLKEHYQCPIRSSLFKEVRLDGIVSYSDVDRVVFYDKDIDGRFSAWHSGMASKLIDEMFPIIMPYRPNKTPYKVYGFTKFIDDNGEDKTSENIGSYTRHYFDYVITPEGKKIKLHLASIEGYKNGDLIKYGKNWDDNEVDKSRLN